MRLLALLAVCACASARLETRNRVELNKRDVAVSWKIVQYWAGSTFWQGWRFFNDDDPTHGAVDYVPASTAVQRRIATIDQNNNIVASVESKSVLQPGQLRKSVRIESKKQVRFGSLIVADFARVPFGPGVWPAFWTVGAAWPAGGEIDILENINDDPYNHYTLHTGAGCFMSTPPNATSSISRSTNCDVAAASSSGCGFTDTSPSFGSALNKLGGGVFVTYFDTDEIAIWFFPRSAIPSDIASNAPDMSSWPLPKARWTNATCDIQSFFEPQTMIINITLCGSWAGTASSWRKTGMPGTCVDAVTDPNNYKNAVFRIKSVKVYERS